MILATESFNKVFLIIFIGAILIGALITCIKIFGRDKRINKIQDKISHDENVLNDESSILKKK